MRAFQARAASRFATTTTTLFLISIFLSFRPSHCLYAADVEKLHVTSWIRCRYAFTTVESRVYNADDASREAKFEAVLPETAVISNFTLVGTEIKTDLQDHIG